MFVDLLFRQQPQGAAGNYFVPKERMTLVARIVIEELRCKGCGLCTIACPHNLLSLRQELNRQGFFPAEIIPEQAHQCTGCAMCARMCPDVAIHVYRDVKASEDA